MEIDEQKRKIADLEKELKNANNHIQFLTQISEDRARRIQMLESQLKKEDLEPESPNGKLPQIKKGMSP